MSEVAIADVEPDHPSTRVVSRFRSGQLHRTIALLAVVSLFIGTVTSFDTVILTNAPAGLTMIIGYGAALALGVLVFTVRRPAILLAVDIGILVCTLALRLPEFLLSLGTPQGRSGMPYTNDEGALVDLSGRTLLHGVDPYTVVWTGAHNLIQPVTLTMDGGAVDRVDYPPVTALLAAAFGWVFPNQPIAALAALAGLLAATILLFVLLPAPWRSAATMICLGLGLFLMPFARQGYPEIIALPFVILAVNRWSHIGAGGRLGALGISSAIGLGLGCATQQIVWFMAPFLLVGVLLLRVGDLGTRRGWMIMARYAGIAGLSFAVINAPFVIWHFSAWRSAMVTPLVARTVPHGQGLIGLTYNILGGSGRLQAYSYATAALAIALLACFALFIRTLGPAMVVLPWPIFFLSIRSSDKYFYLMAPVWLIALATVRQRDFAKAWQVRFPRFARAALALGLLVPAAGLATVAVVSPQPLKMTVLYVQPSKSSYTKEIFISVTNTSGRSIEPHFALSTTVALSRFWLTSGGPKTLKPGETAEYALLPPVATARRSLLGVPIMLRAVSAYPETMSSVALPMLSARQS
ncbi:MAG TPA: hypothetical protein VGJ28_21490 [Micromonosporaceae bacterium]|jgi:hypothetical protein